MTPVIKNKLTKHKRLRNKDMYYQALRRTEDTDFINDVYSESLTLLANVKRMKCPDDIEESVRKTVEYLNGKLTSNLSYIQENIDKWKGMLHKAWKITEGDKTFYMYPYRFTKENSMLFALTIDPENNYSGGVCDKPYDLREQFIYGFTSKEIKLDDFREFAKNSVTRVISYRLGRERQEQEQQNAQES